MINKKNNQTNLVQKIKLVLKIKIDFQSKEHFIKFEFDTLEEDIYINLKIDKTDINIERKDNLRLNVLNEKYKRKLAYKIKWNLKTDKKIIIIKSLIINKEKFENIYEILKKYAVEVAKQKKILLLKFQ